VNIIAKQNVLSAKSADVVLVNTAKIKKYEERTVAGDCCK
jgi:hypothetical protein